MTHRRQTRLGRMPTAQEVRGAPTVILTPKHCERFCLLILSPIGPLAASYRKVHSDMMKYKSATQLLLVLFYAVLTLPLQAQSPEGALVGTVSDATNARVAGASVKLSPKGLSWTRVAKTNSVGEFRIESLPPGT